MDSQLQSSGKEPPASKPTEAPQPPAEPPQAEVGVPALCDCIETVQTVSAACPSLPCVSPSDRLKIFRCKWYQISYYFLKKQMSGIRP